MSSFPETSLDNSPASMKSSIRQHLRLTLGREVSDAGSRDWFNATSMAVRDRMMDSVWDTVATHRSHNVRRINYFSLEYLMGRLLESNLRNTGLYSPVKEALSELGQDLDTVLDTEQDMGLGNGGLGRLAACFLDSFSTLDLPAVGYGIHYEFGLFRQEFVHGQQMEHPDAWTRFGNPWKLVRPEYQVEVPLYGHVVQKFDDLGNARPAWVSTSSIIGIPWDIPIAGFRTRTVNLLRLWEAHSTTEFDFQKFNSGGYVDSIQKQAEAETVSKVLYPNDATENGKELRLVQQYFFVACSLNDIMRRYKRDNNGWDAFPEKIAIQLNDTHPAVSILELMRLLVDEESLTWDKAWDICQRVFSYTNHTLLPEALEMWSVPLFGRVLPRHLEIAFEINRRFMAVVEHRWPGDNDKKRMLSLIDERGAKSLRMAHLSVVGSHATNGVAALHSRLLREHLFPDFAELFPNRFLNVTNGITFRRWLTVCNPQLASLISETIGEEWLKDASKLRSLEAVAKDMTFQERFRAIKHNHKVVLAKIIREQCDVVVSPDAIFDVQIKRLHEYKRQHLNLLHILTLYRRILQDPEADVHPRVFVFGAKAAPGYFLAKNIIYAINSVGEKINNDPRVKDRLKVVFLPNYGVTLAERIVPAADISEQISTAGKEASGTGNMKLALNGALTIGTLDGANVEIQEEVGPENIFIFGLTVEEVHALLAKGYNPYDYYWADGELRAVIDWLTSDYFTGDASSFRPIRESLLDHGDHFLVLADYAAYIQAHNKVDATYRDRAKWSEMAILNTARMGKFSSDRTIHEYASKIWNLPSVDVPASLVN